MVSHNTNTNAWNYTAEEIRTVIRQKKRPHPNCEPEFVKKRNSSTHELKTAVKFIDKPAPYFSMRYKVSGSPEHMNSYASAFFVDGTRVRGIDYCPVARKKFYKETIPAGWHENIIDPNFPISDLKNGNRHESLRGWSFIDLRTFHHASAGRWNIEIEKEDELF